jgi:hypothetical protein
MLRGDLLKIFNTAARLLSITLSTTGDALLIVDFHL